MELDLKTAGKSIVRGISWLFIAAGALIFLVGDRVLHETYRFSFVSAEFESIALAVLLIGTGAALKLAIGDPLGKKRN
jgi:hypothetical protein